MNEQPQTTAPAISTEVCRAVAQQPEAHHEVWGDVINKLCDAVDTLRRQFAGQSTYINSLEHRLNGATQ